MNRKPHTKINTGARITAILTESRSFRIAAWINHVRTKRPLGSQYQNVPR